MTSPCLWTDNKPSRPKGQHPRAKCNKPVKLRPALPNAPNSDRLRGVSRARSPPRPRCHRSVARDDPGARVNRRALWGRISSARSLPPRWGGRWMAEGQTDEGFHRSHAGVRPGGRACAAAGLPGRGPAFDGKSGGENQQGGGFRFPPPCTHPLKRPIRGGLGHGLRKI